MASYQRDVEHIKPDHRFIAAMDVVAPSHGRRNDQDAPSFIAYSSAIDCGESPVSLHDETQGGSHADVPSLPRLAE
ncbi:hypothetical protein ACTMU2_17240 [Cupriavidus basilensis]